MKLKLVLFSSLLLLTMSCTRTQQFSEAGESVIDFSSQKEISLDDFIAEVKYIPMEVTTESSIMEATQVIADERCFYIYDAYSSSVKCFSWNGKFLKQLGRNGQGPGEYSRISSVCADESNIYVLDYKNKIIVFDKQNLSFTKEYNNVFGSTFCKTSFGWVFMDFRDDYSVKVFDNTFNPLYQAVPNVVKSGYVEWPSYRFYNTDSLSYIFPPHYNQIYCITQDSCILQKTISYGKYQTIPNEVYQEKSDHNSMNDIYEDETHVQYCRHVDGSDFFITSFRVGKKAFLGVNCKTDNSTYYISTNTEEKGKNCFVFSPDCSYKDYFVSVQNLSSLQSQEYCIRDKRFQQMSDTISKESDVIVLWKIK